MSNEIPTVPGRRQLHVFGGPTAESDGDNPESGVIANRLAELSQDYLPELDINLHLTNLAGGESGISTDADLREVAYAVAGSYATKMVLWLPDTPRYEALAKIFRKQPLQDSSPRKDIFLVGMTSTRAASGAGQYARGLSLVKQASANLALTYDYETRSSMVVAPEESAYDENDELDITLRGLLEIANLRSQLSFTRSTVVAGEPVSWDSPLVYPSLRQVVNFCIQQGAYKPFLGVTAGHFAAKIGDNEFLTSRRKTDFNDLPGTGLIRVVTDGPDRVVAMGAKPSVGGQSQRIVFADHPETDSIVHFHCPIRPGSNVPTVSQREYECGSHECGQNTSNGLAVVEDGIEAVYLDNHGPNIVFHHDENPAKVSAFIADNFDLHKKTGGYALTGEVRHAY